jgi:hypothetical protein
LLVLAGGLLTFRAAGGLLTFRSIDGLLVLALALLRAF